MQLSVAIEPVSSSCTGFKAEQAFTRVVHPSNIASLCTHHQRRCESRQQQCSLRKHLPQMTFHEIARSILSPRKRERHQPNTVSASAIGRRRARWYKIFTAPTPFSVSSSKKHRGPATTVSIIHCFQLPVTYGWRGPREQLSC